MQTTNRHSAGLLLTQHPAPDAEAWPNADLAQPEKAGYIYTAARALAGISGRRTIGSRNPSMDEERQASRIVSRTVKGSKLHIKLEDGQRLVTRRFFPGGTQDDLFVGRGTLEVHVKKDDAWIEIGEPWRMEQELELGQKHATVRFKEIETDEELALYEDLRAFHYRGGGGAGRTVPLIASSDVWDLPKVLGFIELSSSMIANTARKRFLDSPYSEPGGVRWKSWDRVATKSYSNLICRISRFVIHPEIRGLGLAKHFTMAARTYARERWFFGGHSARFLEITADMLRYYKFVDDTFASMGMTEGNHHRLAKDMTYLVRRARMDIGGKGMPQGGGGIMTLQRGYASQLLRFLDLHNKSLPAVIDSLRHDPAALDQDTWEALYRLNRRPKPSYISGLTQEASKYVLSRRTVMATPARLGPTASGASWKIGNLAVTATARISQSAEARILQDTFGFVGSVLTSNIVRNLSFELWPKTVTLVCGASGSGKSLMLEAVTELLSRGNLDGSHADTSAPRTVAQSGEVDRPARLAKIEPLADDATPLLLRGRASLEDFLKVTAKCGLAEPQLFVREVGSLSSGQKYRLQIALAFLQRPEVLIIDNFCEPLDHYTAIAVIRGIRMLAREVGTAVVVATAAYERIDDLLSPDQTILLRRGDDPLVRTLLDNG